MNTFVCRTMLNLAWVGYIHTSRQGMGVEYDYNSIDKMSNEECVDWMNQIMSGKFYLSASPNIFNNGIYGACLR